MDIDKLTQTQLSQLIGNYMRGLSVSWSHYDRAKIVEVLKTNGYIFSIITKIARAAKNVHILVGRHIDDTFEEDRNSPLYKAIKSPNAFMSEDELKEFAAMQFFSFGETFLTFETFDAGNNRGQIIDGTIQLAPPDLVNIKHDRYIPEAYVIDGDVTKVIPIENCLHIKSYNPDYRDLHGLPYVTVAGKLIDKLNAADETETKTFQNSGPSHLVSPKFADSLKDKSMFDTLLDNLRKIWRKNMKGVAGVNVPMDVLSLGSNPADMGTLESQKNTMKILLTLWGLDAGLFDTDASTYNNKQQMEQYVYTEAAIPFMEKLVSKINARFEPIYGVKLMVDTSDVEVLQPNYRDKVEWMKLADAFSENEIREAVNYERVDTEDADLTPSGQFSSALAGFDNLDREVIEQ
jgi:HK97 family phage portal protein